MDTMVDELWQDLEKASPHEVAIRAIAEYDEEEKRFTVDVFNKKYIVDLKNRQVIHPEDVKRSGMLNEVLLHYLVNASDVPLSNTLVSPNQLTDGAFFFRGSHELPLAKITEKFDDDLKQFVARGLQLGGQKTDFGDAAVRLQLFPRIPVIFALWHKDDEFDSEARVILDSSVEKQMSLYGVFLAMLYAIGKMSED
jgi:hypothetical protein